MATIETRPLPNGGQQYRVKIRVKGHPAQSATFSRLTDARRWAQNTESAIRERRYFKTNEDLTRTLSDAIDRYVKEVLPEKCASSRRDQYRQLIWWRTELGAYFLADITPARITECRNKLITSRRQSRAKVRSCDALPKPLSAATVVRYLAALSHVFSVAAIDWQWVQDNPVKKIRKPKEPKGRDRFLSDDERARLLEACRNSGEPYLYPVVVLALSTGMRRGEIMSLRWNNIDMKQGRITLLDTKNGDTRSLPLVGEALAQVQGLAKVRSLTNDMLFPGKQPGVPIELKRPWCRAIRAAAIENFRFHDLRHSAASYLAMSGASTVEIAAILGHRTLAMVKRYSHLNDAHTRSVLARMNSRILQEGLQCQA